MATYLFKTEPDSYSYSDLVRDKRTVWDGIKNPVAQKHLRGIRRGDTIVIYHTGKERQAVGLARAASDAFGDPGDPSGKRSVVHVRAAKKLPSPVPLATFKSDAVLKTSDLVRISRLSVVPLSEAQLKRLLKHAGA